VSGLAKLYTHNSLKLLLLLGGRHNFTDKQLYIVKINIVTANIFYFSLDEVWMHQNILC